MNTVEAFAEWLVDSGTIAATLGQNLFISKVPLEAPNSVWWLKQETALSSRRIITGELEQPTTINIYYRDRDSQAVYNKMQMLNQAINTTSVISLEGFDVYPRETVGPFVDTDLDDNERDVGLLQVTIITYKENSSYGIS